MNKLRKLTCLLLALVMVFALAATASADSQHTITVPDDGRNYNIYQIFVGDLTEDENGGKVLSNLTWGVNGTGTTGAEVDENTLNALAAVKDGTESEKLTEILKYVTLSNPVATVKHDSPYACADGYYLIQDAGTVGAGEAYGRYLVNVAGDVTLTPKVSKVTFEKKLKDNNDTTGVTSGWQDSADYDIGDSVPFQLKGTVAEDMDKYTGAYYFAFHDKMEDSLTFDPSSVKVYVGNQQITTGYTVTQSTSDDECTFEVIFEDLMQIDGVKGGSEIIVEYTAELNNNAVLGNQGNLNQAKLEYSNNPYSDGKGETNWDNVIVFTYQVVVNKYANSVADGNEKTGAAFKLEKLYKDPATNVDTWKTVKEFPADENTSTFTFKGLDDGKYRLTETETPAGFNTIDPIEFTVTAEHTITWEGETRTTILTSLSGGTEVTGEITFTPSNDNGTLTTNVVNKSGSTLPETGGMGTTLFYVLGGALVLAAVVLLVTKKRMRSED